MSSEESSLQKIVETAAANMRNAIENMGFSLQTSLKIADPKDGHRVNFEGQLIGPGPDIDLDDQPGKSIPTWLFHPMTFSPKTKDFTVDKHVTVKIIAPAALDQHCRAMWSQMQLRTAEAKAPIAAQCMIMWAGLTKSTKAGRSDMNNYNVAPRYVAA